MADIAAETIYRRTFLMISATDHLTGLTGLTPTVQIKKNGGSFAAAAGAVTENAFGWYTVALTVVDTNTEGELAYHITATGADPTDFVDQVIRESTSFSGTTNVLNTPAALLTRVKNLLGTDPQLSDTEISSIAQSRYEALYESYPWSRKLRDFTMNLVATVSSTTTDTVTVTNGSAVVTSAGTPFTSAMLGRQIRIGAEQQYHFINSVTSTSAIKLGDGEGNEITWARATNTAAAWTIFKTLYTLPSDADWVVTLAGQYTLDEFDGGRAELDLFDPYRLSTTDTPTHWLYAGVNSSNVRELELWPAPTAAQLLRGQYARQAPTLESSSTVDIHFPALIYGTTADCYNMLYAKTGDEAYQKMGLFYEKKVTQVLNDVLPYEVAKWSPPRTIQRRQGVFGRGTDFEVDHDLDAMEHY